MPDRSPLSQQPWFQNSCLVLLGLLSVFAFVYIDVVIRAHHAFSEAEKYMSWSRNPALKSEALNREFAEKKAHLDQKKQKNKMTEQEYQSELESLEFDKKFQMDESSLKYAYQWYKDTYELFSPPESKWVKMAREKAPSTLELWKQELHEKKIPFEETMVQ